MVGDFQHFSIGCILLSLLLEISWKGVSFSYFFYPIPKHFEFSLPCSNLQLLFEFFYRKDSFNVHPATLNMSSAYLLHKDKMEWNVQSSVLHPFFFAWLNKNCSLFNQSENFVNDFITDHKRLKGFIVLQTFFWIISSLVPYTISKRHESIVLTRSIFEGTTGFFLIYSFIYFLDKFIKVFISIICQGKISSSSGTMWNLNETGKWFFILLVFDFFIFLLWFLGPLFWSWRTARTYLMTDNLIYLLTLIFTSFPSFYERYMTLVEQVFDFFITINFFL